MSILCATDFSDNASAARTVSALLAKGWRTPVHLGHSVELEAERLGEEVGLVYAAQARKRLQLKAQRLRELGASVEVNLESGPADESMLGLAKEISAELIVVGALGQRKAGTWKLGSRADRLSQLAHVPVLVVRDSQPFLAWVRGERPLKVVIGADRSETSRAALRFVDRLRQIGRCDVTALHLYWPPAEFARLGYSGVRSYAEPDPEVSVILEQELREHLASEHPIQVRLEPHLGRIGDRLASLAAEQSADLLVVGSHARTPLRGILEGSVSRVVAHQASMSVACVPSALAAAKPAARELRNLLVATDFSSVGNAALSPAYSIAQNSATVHLVHVVQSHVHNPVEPHDVLAIDSETATPEQLAAREALRALIPKNVPWAAERTRVHLLESNDPARAICQAAERLDVDLLCLGTHGRGAATSALLGSIARGVLETTHRPVLLARAPKE